MNQPSLQLNLAGALLPRANLNLKQLDPDAALAMNGQPLSPTQTSSNRQSSRIVKDNGKQKSLKGPPQQVGLTTIEYDLKLAITHKELTKADMQNSYLKELYDETQADFPFKSISEQFAPGDTYQRVDVSINLPFDMSVEQIEIQIANNELFSKYLKLLRIQTHNTDRNVMHLRGGFYDKSKKILEVNTCGVTNLLRLIFLYNYDKRPKNSELESMQRNNISDKIKNEIIPLLNGPEFEMDELDDEVAMISNKKSQDGTDAISTEEIKIELKNEMQRTIKSTSNKNDQQRKSLPAANNSNVDEEGRNFNTNPRNYSESQAKEQQDIQSAHASDQAQSTLSKLEHEIFSEQAEQQTSLSEIIKLLSKGISLIKVIGFNCNQIPAITSLTTIMNNSFLLKKEGHIAEAFECDFIIGVLLISSKRYTQAVEIFRKIEAYYLTQIDAKVKDQQAKSQQNAKLEINKMFIKCALLELLTVESMCQATQINDKLQCMKRMCDLFQGKVVPVLVFAPQIHIMDDPYSTMLRLLPVLLKFVLMCVTHKKEIVRMSSMKLLEFILETKGCSLDTSMVFILKAILTTYPAAAPAVQGSQSALQTKQSEPKHLQHQDSFCLQNLSNSVQEYFQYQKRPQQENKVEISLSEYRNIKEPNSGFVNAQKNVYNHVLETYISVLSSISSHILHQLFYEVIMPAITSPTCQAEVKIFAIKIAEKIITICQGDLVLGKASLEYFLLTESQKPQAQQTPEFQLFLTNLRSMWASVRTKVFANYSQKGLKTLIDWLVDKMSLIAQNAGINNKDMVIGNMNEDQIDDQSNPDISKLEITEEEGNQLQQIFDIISVVSVSRKKNEEEANSHIKIKQDYILELYLLINPLLFWLDFSVEREERFGLFKSVYQTIKDVLENLPPKRIDIDLLQIMIPILQRTTEFLKNNSPSQSMLRFLEIVLRDIKSGGYCTMQPDLQYFFLEMLNNFVSYISYCLFEEVFSVFDKLLSMCSDVINEKVLTKGVVALVDKYTMKSKAHKNSLAQFMKVLMEVKVRSRAHEKQRNHSNNNNIDSDDHEVDDDQISVHSKNNYFEILCNFCFFTNDDLSLQQVNTKLDNFRSPTDVHDLYIDKMQFFIDSLQMLTDIHNVLFTQMILHPKFKSTILQLLNKGELSLRLKCHEILEVVTNYYTQFCISKTVYELAVPQSSSQQQTELHRKKSGHHSEVMEVEFVNQERLYISQIVVQCIKISLDQRNDSYLQFNSLILLDFLFQNLLPVPTFQNEQLKDKVAKSINGAGSNKSNQNQSINNYGSRGSHGGNDTLVLDIETLDIGETTPEFEVTQRQYMLMRLNLIFKLWPYVQQALNSAWSNIRSICYGLICSMLKIDIRDLQVQTSSNHVNQQFLLKLKQIVLPMLMNLLSSKESESKAGGLNILGSFCGLSYDFTSVKISKNLEFFRKNSQFISLSIWQLVFDLQDDWDITIKEASVVLIQLCAPRDAVKYFDKVKRERENIKFSNMLNRYGMGANGDQSSRLSSSRGGVDAQMQFLNSATSLNGDNEDLLSGIPQIAGKKENILSFLSGTADDMSLVLQMDQHHHNQQNHPEALSASTEMLQPIQGPSIPIKGLRNEKKVVTGNSSATSEELKEEGKKNSYLAEFDDAQQYQEIMEQDTEVSHFVFFVDKYMDEQIQEIISIFRNDFKPPKNLWIEKNPSVALNCPDYYAEIFSQAIEQFNQQVMQLQQQQQQQLQIQLSSSSKLNNGKLGGGISDVLEDELVKKFENERKEQIQDDNFMIFERHYEDKQDEAIEEAVSISSEDPKQQQEEEQCSIDAEPFQFLESPKLPPPKESSVPKVVKKDTASMKPNKSGTLQSAHQLQILDEDYMPKSAKGPNKDKLTLTMLDSKKTKEAALQASKKTTDELIEEYERKIIKTKSLLEEEKKRVAKKSPVTPQEAIAAVNFDSHNITTDLTPDFKSKPVENNEKKKVPTQPPQVLQSHQLQSYLTDFTSKGYSLQGQDNAKLLKQIKNCFNDNSLSNYGSNTMSTGAAAKTKQKLNKSYENLLAANKCKNQSEVIAAKTLLGKKNLSTSPRRGSSSGKKSGQSRASKKKQSHIQDQAAASKSKTNLYNMRDLNFFIKTIERDLSDKFNKTNTMKDFNSMPTTPTSILKKVEDQMKAMALSKDAKTMMSNTCPNIAQVLNSLEQNTSKSVGPPSNNGAGKQAKTGTETQRQVQGATLLPHGYNNYQTLNHLGNLVGHSHNSLSHYPGSAMSYNTSSNQGDKFTFSKTQKIDLRDTSKSMFNYQIPVRDGITHREQPNEKADKSSLSPFKEENLAHILKQSKHHKKSGKRSRGSTDKYLLLRGGGGAGGGAVSANTAVNYGSGSQSFTKLNRSANNIQAAPSSSSTASAAMASLTSSRKKEGGPLGNSISLQQVNNFAMQNSLSPTNNNLLLHIAKQQLLQASSQHNHQVQQQSTSHDVSEIQGKKGGKERTPKKINSHRKDLVVGGKVPCQLDQLELSPYGGDRKDERFKNKNAYK